MIKRETTKGREKRRHKGERAPPHPTTHSAQGPDGGPGGALAGYGWLGGWVGQRLWTGVGQVNERDKCEMRQRDRQRKHSGRGAGEQRQADR